MSLCLPVFYTVRTSTFLHYNPHHRLQLPPRGRDLLLPRREENSSGRLPQRPQRAGGGTKREGGMMGRREDRGGREGRLRLLHSSSSFPCSLLPSFCLLFSPLLHLHSLPYFRPFFSHLALLHSSTSSSSSSSLSYSFVPSCFILFFIVTLDISPTSVPTSVSIIPPGQSLSHLLPSPYSSVLPQVCSQGATYPHPFPPLRCHSPTLPLTTSIYHRTISK